MITILLYTASEVNNPTGYASIQAAITAAFNGGALNEDKTITISTDQVGGEEVEGFEIINQPTSPYQITIKKAATSSGNIILTRYSGNLNDRVIDIQSSSGNQFGKLVLEDVELKTYTLQADGVTPIDESVIDDYIYINNTQTNSPENSIEVTFRNVNKIDETLQSPNNNIRFNALKNITFDGCTFIGKKGHILLNNSNWGLRTLSLNITNCYFESEEYLGSSAQSNDFANNSNNIHHRGYILNISIDNTQFVNGATSVRFPFALNVSIKSCQFHGSAAGSTLNHQLFAGLYETAEYPEIERMLSIESSVFIGNKRGYIAQVEKFPNTRILGNTFELGARAGSPTPQTNSIYYYDIPLGSHVIKGNLFMPSEEAATGLKCFHFKLDDVDSTASEADFDINENLYQTGVDYLFNFTTIGAGTTNLDVETIPIAQANGYEAEGAVLNVTLLDPTKSANNWFHLDEFSNGRDFVNTSLLTEFDYRGFFRQDTKQDVGAFDFDANELEKPANDSGITHNFYKLDENGDPIGFTTLRQAMLHERFLSKDTIIYCNNVNDNLGAWVDGIQTREYSLIIKRSPSLESSNVYPTIVNNAGICLSLDNVSNLIVDGIKFVGNGENTLGCVRIGLMGTRNVIFENCIFENARHGIYQYSGNNIWIKNCVINDVTEYPLYLASGDGIRISNVEMNFAGDIVTPENVITPLWLNGINSFIIEDCVFDHPQLMDALKFNSINTGIIRRCTFKNAKRRAIYFTKSSGAYSFNEILIENCLFEGNLTTNSENELIRVESGGVFKFNNNTVIQRAYTRALIKITQTAGNEPSLKAQMLNNYFEVTTDHTNAVNVIEFDTLQDGSWLDNYEIDFNYYNLESTVDIGNLRVGRLRLVNSEGNSLNSVVAGDNTSTWRTIQLELWETNNVSIVQTGLVSLLDLNYKPISLTGDILKNKNLLTINRSPYDNNKEEKTQQVIGAFGHAVIANDPQATPTSRFWLNNIDGGQSYTQDVATPIIVPAFDRLLFDGEHINMPEFVRYTLLEDVSPQNIVSIQNSGEGGTRSSIRISGDHVRSIKSAIRVTISGNTIAENNGSFDIFNQQTGTQVVWYDSGGVDETVIELEGQITEQAIGDGQVSWRAIGFSGIGNYSYFQLPDKGVNYKLLVNLGNSFDDESMVEDEYIDLVTPFIETREERPAAKFKQDKYVLFDGDDVQLISESRNVTTIAWEVINNSTQTQVATGVNNELSLNGLSSGIYSVRLTITNEDAVESELFVEKSIYVNPIPARPYVDFNTPTPVIHKNQNVVLKTTENTISPGNNITRFDSFGSTYQWEILDADTGNLIKSIQGADVEFEWDDTMPNYGIYDVTLKVYGSWGGTQQFKKRLLVVLPSKIGATEHHIVCEESDTRFRYLDGGEQRDGSLLTGTQNGIDNGNAKNVTPIVAGDIVYLQGVTKHLAIAELQGTEENPILLIVEPGQHFEIKMGGAGAWEGARFDYSHYVILAGKPGGLNEYGIEMYNDLDPQTYANTPNNTAIKVEDYSHHIWHIGIEIHDMKFAGMQAKTEPNNGDHRTWRWVGAAGENTHEDFRLMGMRVGYNYIHDCLGEGIYYGYFTQDTLRNPISTDPAYPGFDEIYPHTLGDTKIFRNEIINMGFDAIQLGNHYHGVSEIHDNTLLNPGFLRIFGQDNCLSLNFWTGMCYNNKMENSVVGLGNTPGAQWYFNNILIHNRYGLDGFYFHVKNTAAWDFSTPYARKVSDYTSASDAMHNYVFNNTVRINRTFVAYNAGDLTLQPSNVPICSMFNNLVVVNRNNWKPQYENVDDNLRNLSLLNLMNTISDRYNSHPNSTIENNLIIREDLLSDYDVIALYNYFAGLQEFNTLNISGISPDTIGFTMFDVNGYVINPSLSAAPIGAWKFSPNNFLDQTLPSSGDEILFRVWSETSSDWIYGMVGDLAELPNSISYNGETITLSTLSIIEDKRPVEFPSSQTARGFKGEIAYQGNIVALCISENRWLFLQRG